MKELKFRAWDNESKYMITSNNSIGTIVKRQIEWWYNLMQNWNLWSNDMKLWRYELMQYTGLKDKNWKEIYEWDILKIWKSSKDYYVVFWHDRYCSFAIKSKLDIYSLFFWEALEAEDCEVIWNIYENPELLKDNK